MDIYASRPNRSFVPSVMYHNSAMTINKYVEAERRTIPDARFNAGISLDPAMASSRENPTAPAETFRAGDVYRGREETGPDLAANGAER